MYNIILNVINKLFKIIYYIFYRINFTANKIAEIIITKIIRFYEILLLIISNCGNIFISRL